MIKVLTVEQIRQADQFTIQNEPILSIDLMERAAQAFVAWFVAKFSPAHTVHIFCGIGNNGGDGLAVGRILMETTYKVHFYVVDEIAKGSEDFKTNVQRLASNAILPLHENAELRAFKDHDIVIDALFGSGLSRPLSGFYQAVIDHINGQRAMKIAIDIPSGLFADQATSGPILKADHTISFQQPKLSFLLPEYSGFVGKWHVVDIGLSSQFIDQQLVEHFVITPSYVSGVLRERKKYDHKGVFGKGVIVSGSYGKMGASVLAARAAMRSGIGLLTMHIPACGYDILQTAVPEAMVTVDPLDDTLSSAPALEQFNVVGIGPGMGQSDAALNCLREVLQGMDRPLVIDADALNLLSENRELLELLPANTILTPHPTEFKRLVGPWHNDFERLDIQKRFSDDFNIIVVLKGAHTSISIPGGKMYFNSSGNPGMATAGSGDVLTGIITAMLAQGYLPKEAAILGVYLHGLAGDIAAEEYGQTALVAPDIIDGLPKAFKNFNK